MGTCGPQVADFVNIRAGKSRSNSEFGNISRSGLHYLQIQSKCRIIMFKVSDCCVFFTVLHISSVNIIGVNVVPCYLRNIDNSKIKPCFFVPYWLKVPLKREMQHCGKGVSIWMFSGPYFPTFGLNVFGLSMSPYSVPVWIIRIRKTPNTDSFHAANMWITPWHHTFMLKYSMSKILSC